MLKITKTIVHCTYTVDLPFVVDAEVYNKYSSNCKFMYHQGNLLYNFLCFIKDGNKLEIQTGYSNNCIEGWDAANVMQNVSSKIIDYLAFYYSEDKLWQIVREVYEELYNSTRVDPDLRRMVKLGFVERFNITENELGQLYGVLNTMNMGCMGANVVNAPTQDPHIEEAHEAWNEYFNYETEAWGFSQFNGVPYKISLCTPVLLPNEYSENALHPKVTGTFVAQAVFEIQSNNTGNELLDEIFTYCQNGIGNTEFELLRSRSASVGDMIVNHTTHELYLIDKIGFKKLNPKNYDIKQCMVVSK